MGKRGEGVGIRLWKTFSKKLQRVAPVKRRPFAPWYVVNIARIREVVSNRLLDQNRQAGRSSSWHLGPTSPRGARVVSNARQSVAFWSNCRFVRREAEPFHRRLMAIPGPQLSHCPRGKTSPTARRKKTSRHRRRPHRRRIAAKTRGIRRRGTFRHLRRELVACGREPSASWEVAAGPARGGRTKMGS